VLHSDVYLLVTKEVFCSAYLGFGFVNMSFHFIIFVEFAVYD
jgi:hypothetical protein